MTMSCVDNMLIPENTKKSKKYDYKINSSKLEHFTLVNFANSEEISTYMALLKDSSHGKDTPHPRSFEDSGLIS